MDINKLNKTDRTELERACTALFPGCMPTAEFIGGLSLDTVKREFRKRAKLVHPDMSAQDGLSRLARERFMRLHSSYKLLTSYLQGDAPQAAAAGAASPHKPLRRGRVIAVGGAKGGIGKSILTTNLAVYLASRGHKTVIVDLDLGGANQHLYLGERSALKYSVNDFIHKRIPTLGEAMVQCKYGPGLIGGDSSELGIANMPHAKKIRLIRAVRSLEADYILIDLGGDTTYNILDFFLAADYGLVVTTRDSASYIGAYHFIKAAMYRKMLRIFSAESKFASRRNPDIEHAIITLLGSTEGEPDAKSIPEFLQKLEALEPGASDIAKEAIADFSPMLVVNRIPAGFAASQVSDKLQGVIRRYLSKEVPCVGAIPYQAEIEQSVVDLVPVVARYPQGAMARGMGELIRTLSVQ